MILGGLGVKGGGEEEGYWEDEMKIIMSERYEGEERNGSKVCYMENVFVLDEGVGKDIMVGRRELVRVDEEMV
ncbi:hypothetical protein [Paenibacillus xylanexedens]|uniref:hypothetical protein n=1 Tax=Paenibacillus xylanexedens TaxID=528191 RepID=UPI001C92F1B7|nr:hypothetical protein [Paenibacillus xylanexedens]